MTVPQSETLTSLQAAWIVYLVDAGQRAILYWDVMRRRGNQYFEHMEKVIPADFWAAAGSRPSPATWAPSTSPQYLNYHNAVERSMSS